jgi:hypothetical protein
MAEVPKERRHSWTPKDRQRLENYERDWTGPLRPEDIREQHHDERSKTIQGDQSETAPKSKGRRGNGVTKRKPRAEQGDGS